MNIRYETGQKIFFFPKGKNKEEKTDMNLNGFKLFLLPVPHVLSAGLLERG